jgi:hypothetical protein
MAAVLARDPKNKTTVASRIKSWKEGARRALAKSFRLTNKALNDVLHGITPKPYRPVTKQASPSSRFSTGAGTQQSHSIEPGNIKQSQFSSSFIGAGTQQSQSIEAGTQQPQFIEAGTQQPQFITPTAQQDGRRYSSTPTAQQDGRRYSSTPTAQQDGRRYSSTTALPGVPGGREHSTTASSGVPGGPGHLPTTHEDERRDSSMTALAGIPEGPEHSKYKILLQHHDNMLTRRNATSMTIPAQQGIYFEQSKSFFFDNQHKTNYFRRPEIFYFRWHFSTKLNLNTLARLYS